MHTTYVPLKITDSNCNLSIHATSWIAIWHIHKPINTRNIYVKDTYSCSKRSFVANDTKIILKSLKEANTAVIAYRCLWFGVDRGGVCTLLSLFLCLIVPRWCTCCLQVSIVWGRQGWGVHTFQPISLPYPSTVVHVLSTGVYSLGVTGVGCAHFSAYLFATPSTVVVLSTCWIVKLS